MNTSEFLARCRDAAMVPDNDEDWSDAKWLAAGTAGLLERYTQSMPNMRAGYWLHRITATLTNGVSEYRIPARAIAQGLEKLELSHDGLSWRLLNPLADSQAGVYDSTNPGEPNWFSLEADYVVIYPAPTSGMYLRFSYYLRPNKLQALSALGTIVSTPTSTTIRVAGNPTSLIGSSGTMDVINTTGTNEVAVVEMPFNSVALVSGSTYDVTVPAGTSLARIAAGQVLRAPDTTDYIPLPVELHESLIARTAGVYLLEHGDQEQADALVGKSESAIKRFADTAQPRVRAQPYRVKSRGSYLRRRYG